jgi:hypothetical protein
VWCGVATGGTRHGRTRKRGLTEVSCRWDTFIRVRLGGSKDKDVAADTDAVEDGSMMAKLFGSRTCEGLKLMLFHCLARVLWCRWGWFSSLSERRIYCSIRYTGPYAGLQPQGGHRDISTPLAIEPPRNSSMYAHCTGRNRNLIAWENKRSV